MRVIWQLRIYIIFFWFHLEISIWHYCQMVIVRYMSSLEHVGICWGGLGYTVGYFIHAISLVNYCSLCNGQNSTKNVLACHQYACFRVSCNLLINLCSNLKIVHCTSFLNKKINDFLSTFFRSTMPIKLLF